MSRERARLSQILDVLHSDPHATRTQIDAQISDMDSAKQEVGKLREERVQKILEGLGIGLSIIRTQNLDENDRAGKDLLVDFIDEGCQQIAIQVKSNLEGFKKFLSMYGGKKGILNKKIILINGRDKEEQIQYSFLLGLQDLDNYWRIARKKPILSSEVRDEVKKLYARISNNRG